MADFINREPMLDMYIFETMQLIGQLEQKLLDGERAQGLEASIGEIFRIMHTIKGSSAMMMYNNIADMAHAIEDLFFFLREEKPSHVDYSVMIDAVLEGVDFIKNEISKLENGKAVDGNAEQLILSAHNLLDELKKANPSTGKGAKTASPPQSNPKFYIGFDKKPEISLGSLYRTTVFFAENCQLENIRAFSLIHNVKEIGEVLGVLPENLIDDENSSEVIKTQGVEIIFRSERPMDEIRAFLTNTPFLREFKLNTADDQPEPAQPTPVKIDGGFTLATEPIEKPGEKEQEKDNTAASGGKSFISVNIKKLDKLMDLVGELVIAEAMVTRNPELADLQLDNFQKSARQLRKITNELQDIVMSVRMVPISTTFQKMNRIVRDMNRKLKKEAQIEIVGEETEVDKNIIEHLSDPLMHLIRNSIDHGLESAEERVALGKPAIGKITLEAKNAGSEVWIIVRDDGKGLNREKILSKAKQQGLLTKAESEMTDREVYALIMLAGFSTKEKVTEFSGRGVGMDVVISNIEKVGGSVLIDSVAGRGTSISLKIPLTLAIVDGMTIRVGQTTYTVPTTSIKESFRVRENDVIVDPDGNEMIMVRGECFPVLRLHERFKNWTDVTMLHEGIIMMVEHDAGNVCLFADALLGEQQVVVKSLPSYIKKIKGIAGCTMLGDGNVSLILDPAGLAG